MQYVRPLVVAFFLISVLVAARVVSLNGSALSDALPSPAAQSTRYAVILVLDGARYDQFDMSKMPNLAALAGKGAVFTRATVGQLPSITETSHATIGTGVYPNKHGVLGDRWRVPGTAQLTPTLLDGNLIRSGYL